MEYYKLAMTGDLRDEQDLQIGVGKIFNKDFIHDDIGSNSTENLV